MTCSLGNLAASRNDYRIGVTVNAAPADGALFASLASVFGNDYDPDTFNNNFVSPWLTVVDGPAGGCLVISGLQPGAYLSTGGQPLSVVGGGFQPGATLTVATNPPTGTSYVSPAQLGSTSPALPTGRYDVVVTNPDQSYATLIGGYVVSNPVATGFVPLTPCRVFDTRDATGTPAMAAWASRTFAIAGRCGIPSSARSIAVNLTVVPTSAGGSLTLYAGDLGPPLASFLSFDAGNVRANNGYYPLALNGAGTMGVTNSSAGTVDVVLDAFGYFQ